MPGAGIYYTKKIAGGNAKQIERAYSEQCEYLEELQSNSQKTYDDIPIQHSSSFTKKRSKNIFILIIILTVIGLSLIIFTRSPTPVNPPNIDFEIISVENFNTEFMGRVGEVRYRYDLIVYDDVTINELIELAEYIIYTASVQNNFDALKVWFFRYEDYTAKNNSNPSLGEAIYSRGGTWDRSIRHINADFELRINMFE